MPTKDSRVDAYIAKSAAFARPILQHLRQQVHRGCPAAVETIKWRMPFFEYKGLLCAMAAFKAHCAFLFWRDVKEVVPAPKSDEAMGQLGRIKSLADLPRDGILAGYVRTAAARRDELTPKLFGRRTPTRTPAVRVDRRRAVATKPRPRKTSRSLRRR